MSPAKQNVVEDKLDKLLTFGVIVKQPDDGRVQTWTIRPYHSLVSMVFSLESTKRTT